MKYTHNTAISSDVVLSLEDELDEMSDTVAQASKNYKCLCQYVPQDALDNFLGWFGQESIERYVNETKEHTDKSVDWFKNNWRNYIDTDKNGTIRFSGWESDYRKAMED